MDLRWLKRDGQMVLQSQERIVRDLWEWQDVPTVEEPKKPIELWVLMGQFGEPMISMDPIPGYVKVREVLE